MSLTFGLKINVLVPKYFLVLSAFEELFFFLSQYFYAGILRKKKKKTSSKAQKLFALSFAFFSSLINKLPHSWLHLIFLFKLPAFLLLILLPENLSLSRN